MASSFVDIANAALIRIGQPVIASFSDGTPIANLVNLRWEEVRDIVLRRHPWNCATTRVLLAPDSAAPAFGYGYQFTLPADFVREVDICQNPYGSDVRMGSRPRYAIESGKILFDWNALYLRYVYQVTNAALLDVECAEAIATYLAYDLAQTSLHNEALTKQLHDAYEDAMKKARNTNGQELNHSLVIDHYEAARRWGPG